MNTERIAYLAGLVDGEAYIGIKRTHNKHSPSPVFHERIQVRMVHKGSIRLLQQTFQGSCYLDKEQAGRRRALYCWQVSDLLAAKALATLLPFLVIKKESARTVLRLRTSKETKSARLRGSPSQRLMRPSIVAHRQALYERCKALNH